MLQLPRYPSVTCSVKFITKKKGRQAGGKQMHLGEERNICSAKEAVLFGLPEVIEQIHSSDKWLPQTY